MLKLQTTLQVSNCDRHPLNVTATINAEYVPMEGWSWEVESIDSIELVIGDKVGIDITRQVLSDKQAAAIVLACAADCDEQIYAAIAGRRVAV